MFENTFLGIKGIHAIGLTSELYYPGKLCVNAPKWIDRKPDK